jgi:4-diphosphocytidyl-2-C-methyl-D-erythritol kinase
VKEIELKCPAKVNLFLEVLGKREDGFHEIETVMAPVGLYDSITFRKKTSGIDVRCDSPEIPEGKDNLVFKAISLLAEKTGFKGGVEACIKKNIPAGSGLGGGSSDAAAAFAACNLLFGLNLSRDALLSIGSDAGSDVPFFIRLLDEDTAGFSGGAFIGRGRGEQLEFAGELPGLWTVIVSPGFFVSTADVYGALSLTGERRDIKIILEHIRTGDAAGIASCLSNRLEDAAENPRIKGIKDELLEAGALGALMTGSGSAVFGIASGEDDAFSIRERMLAGRKGGDAYAVCTLKGRLQQELFST